jgi:hypothetical protein
MIHGLCTLITEQETCRPWIHFSKKKIFKIFKYVDCLFLKIVQFWKMPGSRKCSVLEKNVNCTVLGRSNAAHEVAASGGTCVPSHVWACGIAVRLMWLVQCGTRSYNGQGAGNSSYMRYLVVHRALTLTLACCMPHACAYSWSKSQIYMWWMARLVTCINPAYNSSHESWLACMM